MDQTSPSSQSPELLALRRRRIALLRQKAELVKGFGLLNYKPHPKQDKFHCAGAFRRRLVTAGNRFGKSHMGCAEDCAWLYGERVWYPKGDSRRTVGIPQRPVKGLVIAVDWEKVDEIWTSQRGDKPGKLWQLLPKDFVVGQKRNHSGAIATVECANGSTLTFDTVKSYKANPLGSESSDWDFMHVDEPCPEKMFKAHARGLVDRSGSVWFTLTPLQEAWILDMFFPQSGSRRDLPMEASLGSKWALRGSMHDNPTLSEEGKAEYISSLTAEEQDCRVNGIPLEFSGLVYKEFQYDKHVLTSVPHGWESYRNPPKDWPIYVAIDPHPRTPHAILFLTVSPQGQKFFYDEVFRRCLTSELCKEEIRPRLEGRHVIFIKCDPLAYIPNPITGETIESDFARHGVFVEKATKALAQGILRTKEEYGKADNIYVCPHLEEYLFEVQRYAWDEEKEKPKDINDHMMENQYRLLLEDPGWVPQLGTDSGPIGDMIIDRAKLRMDDLSEDKVNLSLNDL